MRFGVRYPSTGATVGGYYLLPRTLLLAESRCLFPHSTVDMGGRPRSTAQRPKPVDNSLLVRREEASSDGDFVW